MLFASVNGVRKKALTNKAPHRTTMVAANQPKTTLKMTFAFLAGLFSIPIDLLLWVNI